MNSSAVLCTAHLSLRSDGFARSEGREAPGVLFYKCGIASCAQSLFFAQIEQP